MGHLAPFDLMFDGVKAALQGHVQAAVLRAERQLSERPLAARILKCLFLLKWVREFKTTARNIAILVIDHVHVDIAAHEKAVQEQLNFLEIESYLQRNGDLYEFLTDEEKDIEVEIKNTDIDDSAVNTILVDILFKDILRDPKLRYADNNQDYAYSRKLDDALIGREHDLAINVITPQHPNFDRPQVLAAQNTGRNELLVVLPPDNRLLLDARLHSKPSATHRSHRAETSTRPGRPSSANGRNRTPTAARGCMSAAPSSFQKPLSISTAPGSTLLAPIPVTASPTLSRNWCVLRIPACGCCAKPIPRPTSRRS